MDYQQKQIIILSHVLTTVPAQDLKEYFLDKKVKTLMFIAHPLFYVKGRPGPYFEIYENGILTKKVQYKNRKFIGPLQYAKDFILTLYWVIKTGKKWDLIISLDNLNTLSSLILRELGLTNKVVYYTIDFVPNRFNNKLMNLFYNNIEKTSVRFADVTWNLTERVAKGREKVRGMKRNKYNRQVVVPLGVWFNRTPKRKFQEIEKHSMVYAGGLVPHQGVQLVLDAMPQVLKQIKDLKFYIIGIGEYEQELKNKVKNMGLKDHVKFLGYMEKHEDVEKELSRHGVAMAMYSPELSKWSYYGDPSKIKNYLSCGLPVITTSLTLISKELMKKKCGLVAEYQKDDLAKKILEILSDSEMQKAYRANAIEFSSNYDWNKILDNAVGNIIWKKN